MDSQKERKSPKPKRSLKERLETFYGKPIEEIDRIRTEPEIDWGSPRGKELN